MSLQALGLPRRVALLGSAVLVAVCAGVLAFLLNKGEGDPIVLRGRVSPAEKTDLTLFAVFPGDAEDVGEGYVGRPGTHRIQLATTSTGGDGKFVFRSQHTPEMTEGAFDPEVRFAVYAEQVRPSPTSLAGEIYCSDWEGDLHLAQVEGNEIWVDRSGDPPDLRMSVEDCGHGALP